MEEGVPWLLDALRHEGVPATFFTTGDAAVRFPGFVADLLGAGHELACHGMSHRAFTDLTREEARLEIRESAALLRASAPVTAFRAPYLRFPEAFLGLLEAEGFQIDSSRGKYKPAHWGPTGTSSLTRVPASITSSWLRLPASIRDPMIRSLADPLVLFVHPWEYVDLRRAAIPWDCRAGTGRRAKDALHEVLGMLKDEGARFVRISELVQEGSPS
jgi:peptidoglycan/xylan/chitin deacetylase (PgdA/CDA1 family)